MSKENDNRTSPSRRLVRAGSILFYVLLGGWIVWLGLTRWHGTPAEPRRALNGVWITPSLPIDPAWDRTEVLTAALAAIPPAPAWTLPPPPPGMRWSRQPSSPIDPIDALCGEWTPETRPHLQAVIAYLQTPAVETALAQLATIEPGGWRPFNPQAPGVGGWRAVRNACKLLNVRARWHHASRHDVDSALADLESSYRLAVTVYDSGDSLGPLVGLACDSLTDDELLRLAYEEALAPAQAGRILACLQHVRLDRVEMWRSVTEADTATLLHTVDLCWTDDGRGNGWLALSHLDNIWPLTWASQPRCGAWNVLSPLFNDRRTVVRKIHQRGSVYERIPTLSFNDAEASLEGMEQRPSFNLADGPLPAVLPALRSRVYTLIVRETASLNGCIATIALSAYRHDHGQYPATLDELLDGYLDAIPLDPCTDEPLRYRKEGDRYILYSIGTDGVDNAGERLHIDYSGGRAQRYSDFIYPRARIEPYCEPELEELEP